MHDGSQKGVPLFKHISMLVLLTFHHLTRHVRMDESLNYRTRPKLECSVFRIKILSAITYLRSLAIMQFTIILAALFAGLAAANLHPMYVFPNPPLPRCVLRLTIPKRTKNH
jgi:hypothetical protein